MAWVRNPFFSAKAPAARLSEESDADADADADADVEAGVPVAGCRGEDGEDAGPVRLLRPTDRMTGHQCFYIFGLDGIGAMILSGGINFAIAYAMYITQDSPVRLFQLPNTLAGDAAVTIIVQCIITWLIELVLVNRDLHAGQVAPIGFIAQPSSRPARWFLQLDRDEKASAPAPVHGFLAHWALFLYSQVLRGFLMAVPSFCLLWGPAVGILTAVGERSGGDWVFDKTWTPQVFKLVLAGVLALLTTPLCAMFWLVRAGWDLQGDSGGHPPAAAAAVPDEGATDEALPDE